MAVSLPTLADIDVRGKTVLLRVDFNVPMSDGQISDDNRIRAALPTIQKLRESGAKLVICSHLGRPKGRQADASLLPVAERLANLLKVEVVFSHDIVGDEVVQLARELPEQGMMVLENLRFDPREQSGDEAFARQLAAVADLFVNDAFGAMHRSDASITGVVPFLPSAAGLLVQAEVEALSNLIQRPERPFGAIIGGAKVSSKIGILSSLLQKVDHLFIGGAMAYTFLAARGESTGKSKVEPEHMEYAKELLAAAALKGAMVHLPTDHVVASEFSETATPETVTTIPEGMLGLDIGPETVKAWSEVMSRCKTLFWNGPLGVFEWDKFSSGTKGIAVAFASSKAFTVVGGGDSAAAAAKFGITQQVNHVSTGGGASLEYIENRDLVGLAALRRK